MRKNELGQRLKELREAKAKRLGKQKIPQRVVADKLNISSAAYASWESGRTKPSVDYLPQIATYFNVSIDVLLGYKTGNEVIYNEQEMLVWSQRRLTHIENEEKGVKAWKLLTEGKLLNSIANELDITSSAEREIERYVKDVIYTDLVGIDYMSSDDILGKRVREKYHLMDVRVVRVFEHSPQFYRTILLGEMARYYFKDYVRPGMRVGLAGGSSVSRLVYALKRGDCQSLEVYPLAISPVASEAIAALDANTLVGTLAYRHEGYDIRGYALQYTSRRAQKQKSNLDHIWLTQWILNKVKSIDIGFIGVGSMNFRLPPYDPLRGIIENTWKLTDIIREKGAIGDILYNYFNKEGKFIDFEYFDTEGENQRLKLNDLVCAIKLSDVQQLVKAKIPIVIIASGQDKTDITRVAIQSRYANVLIVDDQLARALLDEP